MTFNATIILKKRDLTVSILTCVIAYPKIKCGLAKVTAHGALEELFGTKTVSHFDLKYCVVRSKSSHLSYLL